MRWQSLTWTEKLNVVSLIYHTTDIESESQTVIGLFLFCYDLELTQS